MQVRSLLLSTALAASILVPAEGAGASTLWNNGGPTAVTGGFCDQNGGSCGFAGWTVYDDFQLASAASVGGLTYSTYIMSGNPAASYASTNYSIWTVNPGSAYGTGPIVSGTVTGTVSANGVGGSLITISGLNIALGAGTYWLGLQNNTTDGSTSVYVPSTSSFLGAASQAANGGAYINSPLPDASFTVESLGVPEPATWALMLGGFGLAGVALRRRTSAAAA